MVSKVSEACFSQLKGRSHVGYPGSVVSEQLVPRRQNLSLLTRERRMRLWGAIVGGRGSKVVDGGSKSKSEERTRFTSKVFEMMSLMTMSRVPT